MAHYINVTLYGTLHKRHLYGTLHKRHLYGTLHKLHFIWHIT